MTIDEQNPPNVEVIVGARDRTSHPRQDLTGITLKVLFIGSLILASLWIMRPFLPAIVWAITLVVATWPVMLRVQRYAGNRRGVAVLIMTLALLLVLVVPLWLAISTIIAHLDDITDLARQISSAHVLAPPDWLADVPLIGTRATETWQRLGATGMEELRSRLIPYAGEVTRWFASAIGSLGSVLIEFLLTIGIASALYAGGEWGAAVLLRFGRRLGGERGELAVRLGGQAIRGVAVGVVITALAQSLLGGIGLAIVGLPFAPVLTALMFMLCLAQLGPVLVMVPATIWMFYSAEALWATVLLVFTIVAMTMDNFIRPVLIRKGADLPLPLILAGVIGGMIAMGLLGIFIGPTVLAIAYTLLNAWMAETEDGDQA
jgi:predicted PurR-regulated permease PerM